MGTVNRDVLEALNKSFNVIFQDSLKEKGEGELIGALAMKVSSAGKLEEYDWLNDNAQMREWVGERKIAGFKAHSYVIPNLTFESTLRVKRTDIEDDRLGLYTPRIRQLPEAYTRKRRQDIVSLLEDGTSENGYDGVPFFSDSHPDEIGGTQSNFDTATPLTGPAFDAAMQKMELLHDDNGDPLDVTPDTLVIGPALRATARDLFQMRTVNGGEENPYFGAIPNTIIESRMGTSEDWYLFDTSQELKPIILQNRKEVEFDGITNPDAEYVFMNDAYLYGLRARYGIGYGLWQLAYRANAA